jgi:hypothetical protein
LTAECGVAAVVIVGVQPVDELGAAFGVAAVEAGVGLFVRQRAVKSFYFSVGLWPIRSGASVLDTAQGIGEGVIGSKNRCPSTLSAQ